MINFFRVATFLTIIGACTLQSSKCWALADPVQSLQLQPAVVGIGNDSDFDGHWDQLFSGCCLAYNGAPSSYNYRSAIEFDLANIPSQATIQSAVFNIRYDGANGAPGLTLQFNQYVGNGAIELPDFERINQFALLNSFGPGDGTLWYKIPIKSIVETLRAQGQRYLGVMVQNTIWTQTALLEPYIAVTFVPEPSLLSLVAICPALLCWRRQRR